MFIGGFIAFGPKDISVDATNEAYASVTNSNLAALNTFAYESDSGL